MKYSQAFLAGETSNKQIAISFKDGSFWRELTYGDLKKNSQKIAQLLCEAGVQRGDRVAILSESRPEWISSFIGILDSAAVATPLDTKLTAKEISEILKDARPAAIFYSGQYADIIARVVNELKMNLVLWDFDKLPEPLEPTVIAEEVQVRDTAVMIYTSGTTGRPKGVMISYGNLDFQSQTLVSRMKITSDDIMLSICPLNHLFELTSTVITILRGGGEVCLCPSLYPEDVLSSMQQRGVTRMTVVPLFLCLVKNAVDREIEKLPSYKKVIFNLLYDLSAVIESVSLKKKFFSRIHRKFGRHFKEFISGGSALDSDVADFFKRIGIPIYQGYGMTEAGPVITVNSRNNMRPGSVGRALSGTEIRILKESASDKTGEILVRGPHVMNGYFGQEQLTIETVDDRGWLHTGDLGWVDDEGYLFITGRKKSLIVLGGGKKVQPEEVEVAISRSVLLKEACLVARADKQGRFSGSVELVIAVCPRDEVLASFRNRESELVKEIEKEVFNLTKELAAYKRPSKTVVSLMEFPKSSTKKIKRNEVASWFENEGESSWLRS